MRLYFDIRTHTMGNNKYTITAQVKQGSDINCGIFNTKNTNYQIIVKGYSKNMIKYSKWLEVKKLKYYL